MAVHGGVFETGIESIVERICEMSRFYGGSETAREL